MVNIKKYRALKGINQADLAKQVGISRTYLSTIEGPNCTYISPGLAKKLAEALDVSAFTFCHPLNWFKKMPKTKEEYEFLISQLQEMAKEVE